MANQLLVIHIQPTLHMMQLLTTVPPPPYQPSFPRGPVPCSRPTPQREWRHWGALLPKDMTKGVCCGALHSVSMCETGSCVVRLRDEGWDVMVAA